MNLTAVLPAQTTLGSVTLSVPDLDRSLAFYTRHLGLVVHRQAGREAALGGDGGVSFLRLVEDPSAKPAPEATGLYHFAILVPTRQELAASLHRLVRARTLLQGASDHGVSEALYLADPDDNGIEIYHDRPREEWPRQGGRLAMRTDPLDLDDLFAVIPASSREADTIAGGTRLGHMHLHVAHLEPAVEFYRDVVGFELQQRYGGQAAFLSAGGYHHHVAVNTWRGVGAPAPPEDATGLREFEVIVPAAEYAALARRLGGAGELTRSGLTLSDPSANRVVLRPAG